MNNISSVNRQSRIDSPNLMMSGMFTYRSKYTRRSTCIFIQDNRWEMNLRRFYGKSMFSHMWLKFPPFQSTDVALLSETYTRTPAVHVNFDSQHRLLTHDRSIPVKVCYWHLPCFNLFLPVAGRNDVFLKMKICRISSRFHRWFSHFNRPVLWVSSK